MQPDEPHNPSGITPEELAEHMKSLFQLIKYTQVMTVGSADIVAPAATKPLLVFSVGCGLGHLERAAWEILRKAGIKVRIVGIDPQPNSYSVDERQSGQSMRPARPHIYVYDTFAAYTATHDISGYDVVLLFVWPNPQTSDAAGYDIAAVNEMSPIAIVAIHEPGGGSGSDAFHRLLYPGTCRDVANALAGQSADSNTSASASLYVNSGIAPTTRVVEGKLDSKMLNILESRILRPFAVANPHLPTAEPKVHPYAIELAAESLVIIAKSKEVNGSDADVFLSAYGPAQRLSFMIAYLMQRIFSDSD